MAEDRTELKDLSSALPEKTEELIKLYESIAAKAEVTPWDELLKIRQLNRR